jgi:hypothetical protein
MENRNCSGKEIDSTKKPTYKCNGLREQQCVDRYILFDMTSTSGNKHLTAEITKHKLAISN